MAQRCEPKKKRNKTSDVFGIKAIKLKIHNIEVKYSYHGEYSHNTRTSFIKVANQTCVLPILILL